MQQKNCCKHQTFPIAFINLQQDQLNLWCNDCLTEYSEKEGNIKTKNLILIDKAISNPDSIVTKLNISNDNLQYLKDFQDCSQKILEQQINEFEKQIEEITASLSFLLNDLKDKMKKLLLLRSKFQNDLEKLIKFEEFQLIIKELNQYETFINPDAVQQIEQRLFQYFFNLQQNNQEELNQQVYLLQNEFTQKILNDIGEFTIEENVLNFQDNFLNKYSSIMNKMLKISCFGSDLLQSKFELKLKMILMKQINQKRLKIQQIYKGTRDGLNEKSFWSKVHGKSNLLMIFKSKSGNVFGGYSPCCWNQNLNNYVQDPTNTSFLFSQTHNEIYPIKDNNSSICCGLGYGPIFGDGHDIHISGNSFQDGFSHLGKSYQWDKFQNKKSDHLFGSQSPKLIELEIYQIN